MNNQDHCVHYPVNYCKNCATALLPGPYTPDQYIELQRMMGGPQPRSSSSLAESAHDDLGVKKARVALEEAEARHEPIERAYIDAVALVAEAEIRLGNNLYNLTPNILADLSALPPRQRRLAKWSRARLRDEMPNLRTRETEARLLRDRSFENVIRAREAHRLALAKAILRLQRSP